MSPLTATNTESPRRPWEQQKPGRTNPVSSYTSAMWVFTVCCILTALFDLSETSRRASLISGLFCANWSFFIPSCLWCRPPIPRLSPTLSGKKQLALSETHCSFWKRSNESCNIRRTVQLLSVCATLIHMKLRAPVKKEMFTSHSLLEIMLCNRTAKLILNRWGWFEFLSLSFPACCGL